MDSSVDEKVDAIVNKLQDTFEFWKLKRAIKVDI